MKSGIQAKQCLFSCFQIRFIKSNFKFKTIIIILYLKLNKIKNRKNKIFINAIIL